GAGAKAGVAGEAPECMKAAADDGDHAAADEKGADGSGSPGRVVFRVSRSPRRGTSSSPGEGSPEERPSREGDAIEGMATPPEGGGEQDGSEGQGRGGGVGKATENGAGGEAAHQECAPECEVEADALGADADGVKRPHRRHGGDHTHQEDIAQPRHNGGCGE